MSTRNPKQWFHGDTSYRESLFRDQRWDRDRSVASANAEGPGIYFTSSEDEARTYGPYLYVAELGPGFKLMPRRKPTLAFLMRIYDGANEEDREIFLSNWDTTNPRVPLARYARQDTMHDAAVSLYGDLIRDPGEWVAAVRATGYDGYVVDRAYGRKHLVVWSPAKLRVFHADG